MWTTTEKSTRDAHQVWKPSAPPTLRRANSRLWCCAACEVKQAVTDLRAYEGFKQEIQKTRQWDIGKSPFSTSHNTNLQLRLDPLIRSNMVIYGLITHRRYISRASFHSDYCIFFHSLIFIYICVCEWSVCDETCISTGRKEEKKTRSDDNSFIHWLF